MLATAGAIACLSEAHAQRSATLSLGLREGATELFWEARSVVPPPGLVILPDYQVHRSEDLERWTPAGERLLAGGGSTNRLLSFLDPAGPRPSAFYRVEAIVERPFADLIGADLARAEFEGANLFGADLSFADLGSASLFAASLREANLRSAVLQDADLSFAGFHGAQLDDATALDPRWRLVWEIVNQGASGRDLRATDLSFANLQGADLNRADLRGADLFALFAFGTDLRGANLLGANTAFLDLRRSQLDATTLVDAKTRLVWELINTGAQGRVFGSRDLSRTILVDADLADAGFANANFNSAIMDRSNLSRATLTGARFRSTSLGHVTLAGADLTSADLSDADLTGAN